MRAGAVLKPWGFAEMNLGGGCSRVAFAGHKTSLDYFGVLSVKTKALRRDNFPSFQLGLIENVSNVIVIESGPITGARVNAIRGWNDKHLHIRNRRIDLGLVPIVSSDN